MVECTRHLEYVIEPYGSEEHKAGAERYVREFFADGQRGATADPHKFQIQQGKVHDALGKLLDQISAELGEDREERQACRGCCIEIHMGLCRITFTQDIQNVLTSTAAGPENFTCEG